MHFARSVYELNELYSDQTSLVYILLWKELHNLDYNATY